MKLLEKLVALTLLGTGAGAVFAAGPTAELKVTGQILPASCTIATASGGVIDYGTIARTSLSATTDTKLARRKLANAITVTCESPTAVSLGFVNNRYSSNGGNTGNTNTADGAIYLGAGYGAGLGFDASGNKIGGYVASVGNFKVDGAVAQVKAGTNGDVANGWGFVSQDTTSRSYYYSLDGATSAIGRVFTADYSVAANIAPASRLDLNHDIVLDGSVTVQVNYL